jgi:GNAT superfamily N-acetyltransferase
MASIADESPESIEVFDGFALAARSWVAYEASGEILGFILAEIVDNNAFVHQVSVLPEHQGAGIGRALLATVADWAVEASRQVVLLTTFDSHVPWNRPLYEHLGFRVLALEEIGPELRAICESETARGLKKRVAMGQPVSDWRPGG